MCPRDQLLDRAEALAAFVRDASQRRYLVGTEVIADLAELVRDVAKAVAQR